MKKILLLVLGLVLAAMTVEAFQLPEVEDREEIVAKEVKKIAGSFAEIVLDKLGDDAEIVEKNIQTYFLEMAGILIKGGLKAKEAEEIIDRSLPLYETFLGEIIKGESPEPYINTYIDKMKGLLKEFGFSNDDMAKIFTLIKDHFLELWKAFGVN